jgi:hypothetical protein
MTRTLHRLNRAARTVENIGSGIEIGVILISAFRTFKFLLFPATGVAMAAPTTSL